MSLIASIGVGINPDSHAAGVNASQEALNDLRKRSGDAECSPDLCIIFASIQYDQEKMLQGVRSVLPNTLIIGCSTAGEIVTSGPIRQHSVSVMLMRSDKIKFYAAVGEDIAKDPRKAGRIAADEVKKLSGGKLGAFMMLPDVLAGNGADIVRGVLESLGDHFPVVGGAAGDDFEFKKTYQYLNDKVYSGVVIGLGLVGDFKIGIGVKHGWIPIGLPKKVTKSKGSVLHELDGKPAIAIYDDYFGEAAAELRAETLAKLAITYPLGIKAEGSEEMLIRDPITVDENGSITCAAEIPEGSDVQLMIGSREEAVKVAKEAASKACEQLQGAEPKAVVIFNCIARNKLFGDKSGDEIDAIQEAIGQDVPLIGFYTYGEQAPIDGEVVNIKKCNPAFHNETVVICVLAD